MNVYVGMDVHRKRSQIAVLDAAGDEQRNRNGDCCVGCDRVRAARLPA